jgi:hypothetical protein
VLEKYQVRQHIPMKHVLCRTNPLAEVITKTRVLNNVLQWIIENVIDEVVQIIPWIMVGARAAKPELHITHESDYVFGIAIGYAFGRFHGTYMGIHMKPPSDENSSEALRIIHSRGRNIKDAIFKTG